MGVLIVGTVLAAEGVVAAHMIRHLHLDDVGTPVGKLPARRRAGPNLCQIYNAKALERRGGGDVRHCCSLVTGAGANGDYSCAVLPVSIRVSLDLLRAYQVASPKPLRTSA